MKFKFKNVYDCGWARELATKIEVKGFREYLPIGDTDHYTDDKPKQMKQNFVYILWDALYV